MKHVFDNLHCNINYKTFKNVYDKLNLNQPLLWLCTRNMFLQYTFQEK